MSDVQAYPIGTPGKKWDEDEKTQWLAQQKIKRSYADEVLAKLEPLKEHFEYEQYGALSCDPNRYPLIALKTRDWDSSKRAVLITGGVHGYETSGVQGAIRFAETATGQYARALNFIVAPCVSPWGYETINRWNPKAIDPNRSFFENSPAEEAAALMEYLVSVKNEIVVHIDLHETTDTDNTEFRPALAARDAQIQDNWSIPDGFYLVGDSERPATRFQTAIIKSVEQTTHIAPPDGSGRIIGAKLEQSGVINYAAGPLGLCMSVTGGKYVTTTEVYPDSPLVNDENCILAQVAAVTGGLNYVTRPGL
jgi:hypothetical protein